MKMSQRKILLGHQKGDGHSMRFESDSGAAATDKNNGLPASEQIELGALPMLWES